MFYGFMKNAVLGPVLKLLFRPWVRGGEHIPADGPVIIAGNHLSFSDSIFMPLMVERKVNFVGKDEYLTGAGVKGRAKAAFFRGVGMIPVDRSGGRASDPAMQAALKVLEAGGIFAIYPEGTRSPDGRLYKGRTGVARIALTSGAPVVPCVMVGTDDIQPPGQTLPKIKRVGVVFGDPMDFSRYEGMDNDRFILRSVTDEIMYALMELSGQEYVDLYATKAKELIAEGKPVTGNGANGSNGSADGADEAESEDDAAGEGVLGEGAAGERTGT